MESLPNQPKFAKFESAMSVLIVEDEADLLMTLSMILELQNYQVFKAQNGYEALSILDEHSIALGRPNVDIIISDLLMPEMDGMELLKNVKMGPYSKIPFLILSGTLDAEKVATLIKNGVDGVLYKPFESATLISEMTKSISRARKKSG